jgi:predicted transcriptional regulator
MPIKRNHLLVEMLREYPSGLTAKDVADRLGADRRNIGSQLSKLAAYGIIKSTRGRMASDASPCAIYFAPSPARRPIIQNS